MLGELAARQLAQAGQEARLQGSQIARPDLEAEVAPLERERGDLVGPVRQEDDAAAVLAGQLPPLPALGNQQRAAVARLAVDEQAGEGRRRPRLAHGEPF